MTNAFLTSGLWGDLFRDPDAARHFGFEAQLGHLKAFEAAWTEALRDTGAVTGEAAARALTAIAALSPDPDALGEGSDTDGVPVPRMVAMLRKGLDEEAARAVHTGATSQDVVDTAFVLTSRDLLALFGGRIEALCERLDALARAFGDRPLTGRTRMQAALPITVKDRLGDWTAPLRGLRADTDALVAEISVVQIGGPVGLGASDARLAGIVADRLGLRAGEVWHTDRRRVLNLGNWLTKVAGSLGKLGQDVALMAQQGIGEVALSGGGGSSAMPHKENPVRAEVLVALARVVAGQQGTLAQAMIHEQERSGTAWAIEWLVLPAMFEATGAALLNAARLLEQVQSLGGEAR
jgi:3-carboxy-cis,cis-muconate cycloisomerase